MNRLAAFVALGCISVVTMCHGHGIRAVRVDDGIGVMVVYDDGTPVSFSEARLFAPASEEQPVFTGITDRHGFFMFRPDASGVWKVTVDDGMGHVVTHALTVDDQNPAPVSHVDSIPKRCGVLAGLALIFGIFGWSAYLRLQMNLRKNGKSVCTFQKEC